MNWIVLLSIQWVKLACSWKSCWRRNVGLWADQRQVDVQNWGMEHLPQQRIISADKVREGLAITFADGKSAMFSAALLYATLPQAQQVEPESEDEADE
jgi:hypothetical protein